MGLHPQAIEGLIQAILHLLHRGYRMILTTHSVTVMEGLWLIQQLKAVPPDDAVEALSDYLRIPRRPRRLAEIAEEVLFSKEIRVYYFQREGTAVRVQDISSLDAWAADVSTAEWGGLATPAERAHRLLARALSATS